MSSSLYLVSLCLRSVLAWLCDLAATTAYSVAVHTASPSSDSPTQLRFLSVGLEDLEKIGAARALSLLAAALWTDMFYLGQSLQFSQVYIIGIFVALWYVMRKPSSNDDTVTVFFVAGGLTAFFDLLTAPVVTLGFVSIVAANPEKWRSTLVQLMGWGVGYVSVWLSKWLIVDLVLSQGLVKDAIGHVINRTVTVPDPQFSHLRTVVLNVQQLIGYDRSNKFFAVGVAGFAAVALVAFRRMNISKCRTADRLLACSCSSSVRMVSICRELLVPACVVHLSDVVPKRWCVRACLQ